EAEAAHAICEPVSPRKAQSPLTLDSTPPTHHAHRLGLEAPLRAVTSRDSCPAPRAWRRVGGRYDMAGLARLFRSAWSSVWRCAALDAPGFDLAAPDQPLALDLPDDVLSVAAPEHIRRVTVLGLGGEDVRPHVPVVGAAVGVGRDHDLADPMLSARKVRVAVEAEHGLSTLVVTDDLPPTLGHGFVADSVGRWRPDVTYRGPREGS